MIKATELRIGNFFKLDDEILTVSTINKDFDDSPYVIEGQMNDGMYVEVEEMDAQPISLNTEWLKRFGFEEDNDKADLSKNCIFFTKKESDYGCSFEKHHFFIIN